MGEGLGNPHGVGASKNQFAMLFEYAEAFFEQKERLSLTAPEGSLVEPLHNYALASDVRPSLRRCADQRGQDASPAERDSSVER
jgi:hypothetical protein